MLGMYKKLWSEFKKQIEYNSIEAIKYEKDPIKIRLDSYEDYLLCFSVLDILC